MLVAGAQLDGHSVLRELEGVGHPDELLGELAHRELVRLLHVDFGAPPRILRFGK